jgi:hypothetical protein
MWLRSDINFTLQLGFWSTESLQSLIKGNNYENDPSFAHERVECASWPENASVNTLRIIPRVVFPPEIVDGVDKSLVQQPQDKYVILAQR